jgi:hypothetical protein
MNPYGTPPPPTYFLAITTTAGGTTDPAPGIYSYTSNSTVQVTAIPNPNYLFNNWILDGVPTGSDNPINILMDRNHSLEAVFKIAYQLTITTTSGGTTNPSPGTYIYAAGSSVEVTAIPYANFLFDYWMLDGFNVGSANPYSIVMDKNHTLKAVFSPAPSPPVGGYSIQIEATTTKPLTLYLALITILAVGFTTIKRKTTRK